MAVLLHIKAQFIKIHTFEPSRVSKNKLDNNIQYTIIIIIIIIEMNSRKSNSPVKVITGFRM